MKRTSAFHTSRTLGLLTVFGWMLAGAGCQPTVTAQDEGSGASGAHQSASADLPRVDAEARLAALGIELPVPSKPVANYVRAVTTGNLVFLAGHIPSTPEGERITGKLGDTMTVEEGYEAAQRSCVALLASLRGEIGDLNRVNRIVKVTGMVNSAPDFTEQSQVINGCSDFLVEVFGERAKHARAAVGMASLPVGAAVEIEMIVEIE